MRAPQPRPSCTLGDITLAVSEAGHKFGRRHVVRPVRLPPEDEDMVVLRELAWRRRVTSDSFERVDICKTMNHIQRRVKRREMELQAERTVESARLPKWQLGAGGYGPLRETEHGEEATSHLEKQGLLTRYFCNIFASTTNPVLPDWIHRRWSPRVLENLRLLDQLWVREALTKMAKNKTSGEDPRPAPGAGRGHPGGSCTSVQRQVIEPRCLSMEHLGAPHGCSYPQAQQRRHADQEPSPYCSTTCDLQVVQPMLGVVVSRRITKRLGVPDSLYTWTTS